MSTEKPAGLSSDPYRREPPTIDLPASEFSASPAGDAKDEPQTAIEPVAATGLDGKTPEETVVADAEGSAEKGDPPPPHAEVAGEAGPRSTQDGGASFEAPLRGASQDEEGRVPDRRRAGVGGLLAASLIGGLVGGGLAVGADMYLDAQAGPPPNYDARIAALEKRPAPPPSPAAPAPSPDLERRLAALEGQVKIQAESVAAARNAAEASAKSAAEAASRPGPTPPRAAAATTAPQGPDPAFGEAIARLEARLGEVEGRARDVAPASALEELRGRIAPLQGGAEELRGRIASLQSGAEERARASAASAEAVKASVSGLESRLAAEAARVGALTAEVAKLSPGTLQIALRAVVAGQVADALRAGAPLGPALAATERLGVARSEIEALAPYAAAGAPGAAALAAEFRPLSERMLAEPQTPAGSFGDRLLRIAEKVVTVRAVGDGSGEDVPGLVGRIEAALARGALTDAAAAWDRLAEPQRAISADWGAKLKRRVAAEAAARKLGADSLAALGAPSR